MLLVLVDGVDELLLAPGEINAAPRSALLE